MKITELRHLIRKAIKSQMIHENDEESVEIGTVKDLRSKPGDPDWASLVKLVLMRKISGQTALYRLETDNWFRRYENPGKGYGIMIRKFRVGNTPIKPPSGWLFSGNQVVFNALVTYLPGEFDNINDDVPQNWETAKGYLILGNKHLTGYEINSYLSPKDFEQFVKSNIRNYNP